MNSAPRSARRVGTALRLSAFLGALLVVVMAASTWATWHSLSTRSHTQATESLTASIADYSAAAASTTATSIDSFTISYLSTTVLPAGQQLIVTFTGGHRYASSGATSLLKNPEIKALLNGVPAGSTMATVKSGVVNVLTLRSPIVEGGRTIGQVMATYDMSSAAADQRSMLQLAIIGAAIAFLAAVLGAYLLLRRLLGTVGRITTTARTIEEGDLDRRLGDQGTDDEVGELAATFDSMLDRIDDVLAMQRRLLADVSHQLKTPLTVIRGHLEVLSRTDLSDPEEIADTLALLLGEVEHMRQLTEQLLFLGRSLERDFLRVEPVALRAFVAELATATSVLGTRQVLVGEVEDVVVEVDEAKLRGALLNLLDNAVKATNDGDHIELDARVRPATGELAITVGDSGPGIPLEQRELVLTRFGRPDSSVREGTGLGLSIVGAVAEAHGGRIEIGVSHLGGLAATVVLPSSVMFDGATSLHEEEHSR